MKKDIQFETARLLGGIPDLVLEGHFELTSGRHAAEYFNKDALYVYPRKTDTACRLMGYHFRSERDIQVVVAPALGAINLSQGVARYLSKVFGKEVLSVFAEKVEGKFAFRRGYYETIVRNNPRTLVVEDVLTTGGSTKEVVDLVRGLGGQVVAGVAICNRGNVTRRDIGNVPRLECLTYKSFDSWPAEDCSLCKDGIPIRKIK